MDELRAFATESMNLTARIERALWQETDEYGDSEPYWGDQAEVPCYRKPVTGQEGVLADRLSPNVDVRIVMPFGTDVTTEDRLVVDGKRYGIDYIPDPSPDMRGAVEAYCKVLEEV